MTEATSWRGELCCDIGLPDINQATSTPQEWVQAEAGGGRGTQQRHMATGARDQGAIQSNESALGREKERKSDGDGAVGNITSVCVQAAHGNSQI